MADLSSYERLRLSVEALLRHPSFPEAQTNSFDEVIQEVRDAMQDLEKVPMRRLVRPPVTPLNLLQGELNEHEYGMSNVLLTHRRGPERRGHGYQPGLKRRKSDV